MLTNLRGRAKRLFGRELSEHAVKAMKVDHGVLNDIRRRAPKLDEAITTPPRLKDGDVLDPKVWERMAEDLWTELYSDDEPSLRARDKIDPRFRINREIADKHARDESFRDTRSMTRGETTESAIGLIGALNSYRDSYGDELSEHAKRQNEIADGQDHLDHIDDMLEQLRQQRNDGDPGGKTTEEIDAEIREFAKQKRQTAQQVKAVMAQQAMHAGDLIDAARKAASIAADKADDAVEAASLLPGSQAGANKRVSPDQMIEFANRVHDSAILKAVLEIMGRIELSMGSVRRQMRKGGYEEMVDIETGDDLRLVLPAEKMLLTHPIGKLDFYRRFHERSLMQYEMWSEQELKKGPIIFAADGSGSMSGAPNIFCRGLTLASCSIGNREGRNTAAIEFGSTGELAEFFFPGNKPIDTEVALNFAEHFFAGGTDINQVLVRARELIAEEEPFHSADLVIVTDGGDRLTDESIRLRDELRAAGVKIHGLMIAARPTQYLVEVCDNVTAVTDFAGPNATSDRLAINLT